MPMKPREMEKLILADGWLFKEQNGSHRQYIHPTKPGKVTIPFHQGKDLNKRTEDSIRKQSVLKYVPAIPLSYNMICKLCYLCIRLVSTRKMMDTLLSFLI